MSTYRIVCVEQEHVHGPVEKGHIIAAGTSSNGETADQNWSVAQIVAAMDKGDTFYTVSPSTGAVAIVEKYVCHRCFRTYIRSHRDAVSDNNLDNMRTCRWAA